MIGTTGVFTPRTPRMQKHHMRARIRDRVRVNTDPITGEPFPGERQYYKVDVWWPAADGKPASDVYTYLIVSAVIRATMTAMEQEEIDAILEEELSEEDVVEIMNAVKEYSRNPVPGGREWTDYLTDEELQRQIERGLA